MRIRTLTAIGGALLAAAAITAPVHADIPATITHCSDWKPSGSLYIQSCVDITGTQAHTYGFVSSVGQSDVTATMTGQLSTCQQFLGYQTSTVHIDDDTVRVEGTTLTAQVGATVRATLFLPGVIGTGTPYGTDGALYVDPTVPRGPAGPGGNPAVVQQITTWGGVITS